MTFTLENYNSQNNTTFDRCIGSEDTIIKSTLSNDCVFLPTIYNRLVLGFNEINNSVSSLVDALSSVNTLYVKSDNNVDQLNQFCVKKFSIYEKNNIYYPNKFEIKKLVNNISTLLAGYYKNKSGTTSNNGETPIVNIDQTVNTELVYNNNIAFNNIINTTVITYNNIKILLTYLATILQHIKIFKWSIYFKTNKFTGDTYIYTCSNVYPELPYNNENTKENTFYSAALLSPTSKRKVVGFLPSGGGDKAEKATNVYSFPANLVAASQTEIALNNITAALIYTTDETSDIPTFDIQSEDGSNGNFEMYRKVTTDTYDLVSQVYDILNLFNIKQSSIITAKSIIQAIDYIFELWHLNIQVLQYDYYLCHYNCHINSINGSGSITNEQNVEYTTYTINYDYNDILTSTGLGANVFSLDANRPTQYTFKYTNAYNGLTYNESYVPSADTLKIQIPYVKYIGNNEAQIYISAYITIKNEKHNAAATLQENIDKKYSIGNWSAVGDAINSTQAPDSIPLSIQYIKGIYDLPLPAVGRSLTSTYILSSPGDLVVHYVVADSAKTKFAIDNTTIKFGDIADGYIYEDLSTTNISNYINMANRGGRAFSTSYKPTPTVSYKNQQSNTYSVLTNLATKKLGFSYIKDNKVGLATISLTCDSASRYYGSASTTYRIQAHNRVNIETGLTVWLANIGSDDIYEDTVDDFFANNCFIYIYESGAISAIGNKSGKSSMVVNGTNTTLPKRTDTNSVLAFNALFQVSQPDIQTTSDGGKKGVVTLTPKSSSIFGGLGDIYFYGEKKLEFIVKQRNSVLSEDSYAWKSIGTTFTAYMEGDAKKSRVHCTLSWPGGRTFPPESKNYRTYTILIGIPSNSLACALRYYITRAGDATQVCGYIGAEYADDGTALGSIVYSDRLAKNSTKHADDSADGQLKFEIDAKNHSEIRVSMCVLSPNADAKRTVQIIPKFKTKNNAAVITPSNIAVNDGYSITYMVKYNAGAFAEEQTTQTSAPASAGGSVSFTPTFVPAYNTATQSWSGWKANPELTVAAPATVNSDRTFYGQVTDIPPEDPPAEGS